MNFPALEKKILKFWQKNKIFEKSIEQRKKAQRFVFYEGPPYMSGRPGIHHFLVRAFKDIILRYKTMRGFLVKRRAGWDSHGLPTEIEAEKKLKIKTKKEIEKLGLEKFITECKKEVFLYKDEWEKFTERIGYWLDLKNFYITCSTDYIETLWFILKKFYQKGFLKEEFRVFPYCPRCQTSLSQAELGMPDAYKEVLDPSIFVKFKVQNSKFKVSSEVYFLVWTTTPWTLPGNIAIAIKPEAEYVLIKVQSSKFKVQSYSPKLKVNEYYILAKEGLKILEDNYKIIKEFKGKDLVKTEYQPLYPITDSKVQAKSYKILPADFVSMEEGTGLVHIAPAFGEEDLNLAKKYDLPVINYLKEDGYFQEKAPIAKNLYFKEADKIIFEDLKKRDLIFQGGLSQYSHSYPHCWRCKSPLFYWAQKSWILKTSKFKEKLLKENQKINWYPPYLKEGRFGKWLAEGKDWNLGRKRYWGTPLPIWKCQMSNAKCQMACDKVVVIGSKKELLKQKFSTNQYFLLRHGETIYQTKKKGLNYSSWLDGIGLTKKGQKEIKVLAKRLKSKKIDLIFSSDLQRGRETAEILAKELNCPIIFEKRLRDINVGIYYGKTEKELYRDYPISVKRFLKKIPQGESWLDCQKRVVNFIEEIDKKYQNKKILILSHSDPLWLLEGAMKGKGKEELIEEKLKKKIIKPGELRKLDFKILPYNKEMELDFHRPYIDRVKFFCCPKCQNLMERVPEVIDCWFDSGAMPFAQIHWPFCCPKYRNIKMSKCRNAEFPADYICEGIDQTRGWFYTLLVVSTLLGFGRPYKNVLSLGLVLDEKGEKMSKSKGNVIEPLPQIEKYGADTIRWYFYTLNQPWDSKCYSEKEVLESQKRFINTLWNCYSFFEIYSFSKVKSQKSKVKSQNLLDKWIISKLNLLIQEVTNKLDNYDITGAARSLENFVIEDLSLWYIRRSRRRFQQPENREELKKASNILGFILLNLTKILAPFLPFLTEYIYKNLKPQTSNLKSVHLEDWPKANKRLIDKKLNEKMDLVRKIVSLGLKARAKAKIKVRQPLALLEIQNSNLKNQLQKEDLLNLIKEELNVKEVKIVEKLSQGKDWLQEAENEIKIALNIKITPELKEEGILRQIIRHLQQMRKEAGFKPKDKISIQFRGDKEIEKLLLKNKEFILKETKAKELKIEEKEKQLFKIKREFKINQKEIWLAIRKL